VPLPPAAARCPSCGHEPGAALVASSGREAGLGPTSGPARPRRHLILAGLVVLGLVALLAVLDGGGGETGARPAATTTSSSSSTTSTTRADVVTSRPTTTTQPSLPSLVLGEASGVRLLVQAESGALLVDLDTGEISRPSSILGGFVVARAGGVVLAGPEGRPAASYLAAPYDGDPVPIAPMPVGQVLASVADDRVWLISASGPPFSAVEVSVDGEVTTPRVDLPPDGYVAGAVDGGLVVVAHGSIFVVHGSNDVTALGAGEVLATSQRSIAALACDDAARCSLAIIDARTRQRRRIDVTAAYGQAVFSPDGSRLALLVSSGNAPMELKVLDLSSGGTTYSNVRLDFNGSLPAFSADGQWLFSIDGTTIDAVRLDDGTVVEIPLGPRGFDVNQVIVLP
jgi:hypothetical protein